MNVLIIDGQGGKIGKSVVELLIERKCSCDIVVVGTNTLATSAMLKAGAQYGATGENPVVVNAKHSDVIIGPMGIIAANSLLGEITPEMALAVSESPARKILIPVNKCNVIVAGTEALSMAEYVSKAVDLVCELCV